MKNFYNRNKYGDLNFKILIGIIILFFFGFIKLMSFRVVALSLLNLIYPLFWGLFLYLESKSENIDKVWYFNIFMLFVEFVSVLLYLKVLPIYIIELKLTLFLFYALAHYYQKWDLIIKVNKILLVILYFIVLFSYF